MVLYVRRSISVGKSHVWVKFNGKILWRMVSDCCWAFKR